jgi:hypothetical protein
MSGGAPVLVPTNGVKDADPIILCMEDIKAIADARLHDVARGRSA